MGIFLVLITVILIFQYGCDAINGGHEAIPNQYPWLLKAVIFRDSNSLLANHCGASLISERWALTARHCIEHEKFR